MKGQSGIELVVGVATTFLFLAICGFITITVLGALPVTGSAAQGITALQAVVMWFYAFIDSAFFVFVIIGLILDLVAAKRHPSEMKLVSNVIGIFLLGFLNATTNTLLGPIANTTGVSGFLPLTTAFVLGNYKVFIIYLAMIFSIILNVYGLHQGRGGKK